MNIAPIVQSLDAFTYSISSNKYQGSPEDFQKILIKEMFAKAFVPDSSLAPMLEDADTPVLYGMSDQEFALQNQILRDEFAKQLVAMDAFGLGKIFTPDAIDQAVSQQRRTF